MILYQKAGSSHTYTKGQAHMYIIYLFKDIFMVVYCEAMSKSLVLILQKILQYADALRAHFVLQEICP